MLRGPEQFPYQEEIVGQTARVYRTAVNRCVVPIEGLALRAPAGGDPYSAAGGWLLESYGQLAPRMPLNRRELADANNTYGQSIVYAVDALRVLQVARLEVARKYLHDAHRHPLVVTAPAAAIDETVRDFQQIAARQQRRGWRR